MHRYVRGHVLQKYRPFKNIVCWIRPLCPGRARQRASAECHRQCCVPRACTVTLLGPEHCPCPLRWCARAGAPFAALKYATFSAIPMLKRSVVPVRDMAAVFGPISVSFGGRSRLIPFGFAAALPSFAASTVRLAFVAAGLSPLPPRALGGEPFSAPWLPRSEFA